MTDIKKLESIIHPLYFVGGSVRDELLGLSPVDFDFATPLLPNQVEHILRANGFRPYTAGRRFGTIGLRYLGHRVEITTFRQETYRAGSRKPDVVYVDDIERDLARRDFTINAMAKLNNHIIDPFGGRNDIDHRLIRSVGNPEERLSEDPLRLLRAARFAAQLDFTIEPATLTAMHICAVKILSVSKERWTSDLDKLLVSAWARKGLEILAQTGILNFILPEIAIQFTLRQRKTNQNHPWWEHTLTSLEEAPADTDSRWSALLHGVAQPFLPPPLSPAYSTRVAAELSAEIVKKIGYYMRWPHQRVATVSTLIHDFPCSFCYPSERGQVLQE